MTLSRRDPQPGLGGVECRRRCSTDRNSRDLPRRRIDAARDVTRDHNRCGSVVDRLDCAGRRFTRLAAEAGTEDRVDDPAGAAEQLGGERRREPLRKPLIHRQRVSAQLIGRCEHQHAHVAPALAQHPRGNEPVTTVIALAAYDHHQAGRDEAADQVGEPGTGELHQAAAGNPALLDRPAVERPLFGGVGQWLEPRRERHHAAAGPAGAGSCGAGSTGAATAAAAASLSVCVSETLTSTPSSSARRRAAP